MDMILTTALFVIKFLMGLVLISLGVILSKYVAARTSYKLLKPDQALLHLRLTKDKTDESSYAALLEVIRDLQQGKVSANKEVELALYDTITELKNSGFPALNAGTRTPSIVFSSISISLVRIAAALFCRRAP